MNKELTRDLEKIERLVGQVTAGMENLPRSSLHVLRYRQDCVS